MSGKHPRRRRRKKKPVATTSWPVVNAEIARGEIPTDFPKIDIQFEKTAYRPPQLDVIRSRLKLLNKQRARP